MVLVQKIDPVTLHGKYVTLEPLSRDHEAGLVEAVHDGELWNLWYTSVPRPEAMAAEIDRRLALQETGSMLPFTAVSNATGEVLGMTSFMSIDHALPRLEIGSTWNRRSAHGTGTNADSKYLLLRHAFETVGCVAVEFRTNWLNHQSREAIARLGAKQDGVLRSQALTPEGVLRDTVVFSILAGEWAAVKRNLEYRLGKAR